MSICLFPLLTGVGSFTRTFFLYVFLWSQFRRSLILMYTRQTFLKFHVNGNISSKNMLSLKNIDTDIFQGQWTIVHNRPLDFHYVHDKCYFQVACYHYSCTISIVFYQRWVCSLMCSYLTEAKAEHYLQKPRSGSIFD